MQTSFRDPDGFVLRGNERILRCILPHAVEEFQHFIESRAVSRWAKEGLIPATKAADSSFSDVCEDLPHGSRLVEHHRVTFPNFPFEWTPSMLAEAARLTLRLAREASAEGYALKDATPYNVMFEGARPVFIDVLSFRRRDPLDPLWLPLAQFTRAFIYPLLASRHLGLRLDELLLVHRDGLEPERMGRICGGFRKWFPPFLGLVTIPALLSRRAEFHPGEYRVRPARDPVEADYLLGRAFARAGRMLERARPRLHRGPGTEYMNSGNAYTAVEMAAKEDFVRRTLDRFRPREVLDAGCNTGHFSLLAANCGANVVAIDRDADCADLLWWQAHAERLPVLPLAVDITRPPGGCGWENNESAPFLERARGRFDAVLFLAILHHLLVTERVPLHRILDLIHSLTTNLALVEFVDPADSQFRKIVRGREALHADLTATEFEHEAARVFEVAGQEQITPTRRIYALVRRSR